MAAQAFIPRALVVDDDGAWQQILGEILGDCGLVVDLADNLPAAVACMKARRHRLAVVDLSLSGDDHRNQDGLAIVDALRRHDPACTAIVLTGHATVELAVSALTEHGVLTCLRKETFRRREFRDLVRRALARPDKPDAGRGEGDGKQRPIDAALGTGAGNGTMGQALVVEDDAGWQSILAELLADVGFKAHVAGSYGEALGLLRQRHFDVAVVDLTLASSPAPADNADGRQVLIHTAQAGIPAIVVSGSLLPAEIERVFDQHGIAAYLEKQAFRRTAFRRALVQAADARGAAPDDLNHLTSREREVLALLAQGMTNKEMAEALVISPNTVKRHLKAIFAKLGVTTRAAAAARATAARLTKP